MLALAVQDEEKLLQESQELTNKSNIPSSISTIVLPPFADVLVI